MKFLAKAGAVFGVLLAALAFLVLVVFVVGLGIEWSAALLGYPPPSHGDKMAAAVMLGVAVVTISVVWAGSEWMP
ncbi:MAG: hypothetical protein U0821_18715 [Chloroflexota bacterium]